MSEPHPRHPFLASPDYETGVSMHALVKPPYQSSSSSALTADFGAADTINGMLQQMNKQSLSMAVTSTANGPSPSLLSMMPTNTNNNIRLLDPLDVRFGTSTRPLAIQIAEARSCLDRYQREADSLWIVQQFQPQSTYGYKSDHTSLLLPNQHLMELTNATFQRANASLYSIAADEMLRMEQAAAMRADNSTFKNHLERLETAVAIARATAMAAVREDPSSRQKVAQQNSQPVRATAWASIHEDPTHTQEGAQRNSQPGDDGAVHQPPQRHNAKRPRVQTQKKVRPGNTKGTASHHASPASNKSKVPEEIHSCTLRENEQLTNNMKSKQASPVPRNKKSKSAQSPSGKPEKQPFPQQMNPDSRSQRIHGPPHDQVPCSGEQRVDRHPHNHEYSSVRQDGLEYHDHFPPQRHVAQNVNPHFHPPLGDDPYDHRAKIPRSDYSPRFSLYEHPSQRRYHPSAHESLEYLDDNDHSNQRRNVPHLALPSVRGIENPHIKERHRSLIVASGNDRQPRGDGNTRKRDCPTTAAPSISHSPKRSCYATTSHCVEHGIAPVAMSFRKQPPQTITILDDDEEGKLAAPTKRSLDVLTGRHQAISASRRRVRKSHTMPTKTRLLKPDFWPTENTVIMGGTGRNFCQGGGQPSGNQRLVELVFQHMREYSHMPEKASHQCDAEYEAILRQHKVRFVSDVVREVNLRNPVAGFVRFEGNQWWEISEKDACCTVKKLFSLCHRQHCNKQQTEEVTPVLAARLHCSPKVLPTRAESGGVACDHRNGPEKRRCDLTTSSKAVNVTLQKDDEMIPKDNACHSGQTDSSRNSKTRGIDDENLDRREVGNHVESGIVCASHEVNNHKEEENTRNHSTDIEHEDLEDSVRAENDDGSYFDDEGDLVI